MSEVLLTGATGLLGNAIARATSAPRPVASITRMAGDLLGQRYLHCSLCSMQWHLLRIRCAHCGSGKHIAYQSLDAATVGDERDADADCPARCRRWPQGATTVLQAPGEENQDLQRLEPAEQPAQRPWASQRGGQAN